MDNKSHLNDHRESSYAKNNITKENIIKTTKQIESLRESLVAVIDTEKNTKSDVAKEKEVLAKKRKRA